MMIILAMLAYALIVTAMLLFFRGARIVSGPDEETAQDLAENAEAIDIKRVHVPPRPLPRPR